MAQNQPKKAVSNTAVGIGDLSQQGAASAQRVANEQRANDADSMVIQNPNGAQVRVAQFLDHAYLQTDDGSIFADPHRYLKHVKEDCMYSWPSQKDPATMAKIRSGAYRPVEMDEIREDTDIPIETHVIAGQKYVAVYDVILVEVQPAAVKRLYRSREAQAALRTAQGLPFQNLKNRVEQESGGIVTAEMEIKDVSNGG